jgi:tetratricopeptide (TPR) repeat protein
MWWKPERGQAYIWMGLTHKYRKEYDKAEGCFYKSLAECNTRREAFWELGVMYDETNRPEQAVIALEAALAIPFKPQGYLANMHLYGWLIPDKLAQIYAKMGRKEDSKRNWLLCLKNKPDKRILANLPYYYGYNLPLISIVVPTCRPEGFQRLVSSIREHTVYPRYEIIEKSGPGTAVEKFNDGVREANGDFIVFLADDCEVELGWLEQAFVCFKERFRDRGLVIFNDHYYNGTLAGHFFCSRNIREDLDD